jgi:MFS family permease
MKRQFFGFSQNVFVLSLVSFLNDIGGETIKRTIPLFLTNVLGVKTTIVGLVEGVGEATPQIFQPISGWLSDKTAKYKPLVFFGQILRSSMIILFWAASWWQVLLVRFLDRSGKGINGAPRDALIVASSSKETTGRSFGLNRALDDVGAVVGLVIAGLIILLTQRGGLFIERETFTKIVLLAVIPFFLALILIIFFVQEEEKKPTDNLLSFKEKLSPKFYQFLLLSFLFTLGNSSDGFLVLKAQNIGVSLAGIFFLLAALNLVASVFSLPAGNLSDKIGRKKVLLIGWQLYSLTYLGFATSSSLISTVALFLAYGLYYGLTEGVARAYVADLVSPQKRGTAFGIYNLVVGGTLLPASALAGFLWQTISPTAPFYFGAVITFLASLGLLITK